MANETFLFPYQGTIAVTAYPTNPQCASQFGGNVAISHGATDVSLYVSFDGSTDAVIIPPATSWNSPDEVSSVGGRIWFKLSGAGSSLVTVSIVRGGA